MALKIVTFEIAKVLKEAGYPQNLENTAYYNEEGMLVKPYVFCGGKEIADTPTYIEVWLWLWREKKKWIDASFSLDEDNWTFMQNPSPCDCGLYPDPEEAIIKAIEYLVKNNLIK